MKTCFRSLTARWRGWEVRQEMLERPWVGDYVTLWRGWRKRET